jgi:hypothetical protein
VHKLEPTLGRASIERLIEDLDIYGLPLANDHTLYTFADIQIAMEKILRVEGSQLITERLKKELC